MRSERSEARELAVRLGIDTEAARARIRRAKESGLTWEDAAFARANGRCDICSRLTKDMVLDHSCHLAGERGWLCRRCKTGLGLFQGDAGILRAAAAYLEAKEP